MSVVWSWLSAPVSSLVLMLVVLSLSLGRFISDRAAARAAVAAERRVRNDVYACLKDIWDALDGKHPDYEPLKRIGEPKP